MDLVLEMRSARQFVPAQLCQMTFREAGGVIGRGEDCDWVIPDRTRHLSHRHLTISCHDNIFFLTDTSSNGVLDAESGARLPKGQAIRINHGNAYIIGDFEIRARLTGDPGSFDGEAGRVQAAGCIIPDDSFLDLDPLSALDQQERTHSDIDELISPPAANTPGPQRADYARVDMESLRVPELVDASAEQSAPSPAHTTQASTTEACGDEFWARFSEALGIKLDHLDQGAREALALDAGRLLRLSVAGLQQILHTRSELKNELRLSQTTVQGAQSNPLKSAVGAPQALAALLTPDTAGQMPGEQAVSQACNDVQAHQVALLAASRAAVRATLEHFSPDQLTLRLERDNPPLLATSSSRWKAYGRYHQALRQDNDWSERLMARDFNQAYEEQIRLITALHTGHQG
jgi:type VI secretion system protein ImpI